MDNKPKYKEGDVVNFILDGISYTGKVFVVDVYPNGEIYYDIMLLDESMLFKHLTESFILQTTI